MSSSLKRGHSPEYESAAHVKSLETKRLRKRREWVQKVEEIHEERMDMRDQLYVQKHTELSTTASSLLPIPPLSQSYLLALYTLTLERDALLSSIEQQYQYKVSASTKAYQAERSKMEDDFKKSKDNVKTALLEKIEEKRRKLREEKESGELVLESAAEAHHTRPTNNRKLRPSRSALSPPPAAPTSPELSLLSLTASLPANSKKRSLVPEVKPWVQGKSLMDLNKMVKTNDNEVEMDLGEIRRKRGRRVAAAANHSMGFTARY